MVREWNYEIWYDGCCISSDEGYETEADAEEMAEEVVSSYLEEWEDTERGDYEIRVRQNDSVTWDNED